MWCWSLLSVCWSEDVTVWQGLAGVEMRAGQHCNNSTTTVTLATVTTGMVTFARVTRSGSSNCRNQEVAPPLDKRVHGVDGRRCLWALVAFVRVFLFLAAVLADEGAVLVELSVPALPVVHQAVVALVTAHRPVGRRPAALQRLVVLCVTRRGVGEKVGVKVVETIIYGVCSAVVRNLLHPVRANADILNYIFCSSAFLTDRRFRLYRHLLAWHACLSMVSHFCVLM